MFVIPCKFNEQSPLYECLTSINTYHPDEKIIIVDSNSEDLSYIEKIKNYENVTIANKKNANYEAGALWIAHEQFPNEKCYALIHDSIILKESISSFLQNEESYVFMYFNEHMLDPLDVEYVEKIISKTKYNYNERNIFGALGNMCIFKSKILHNFIEKDLHLALLPENKHQSQMGERIIGLCLMQEGIDLTKNNIEGNFLQKVGETRGNQLRYFWKIFNERQ
jgi:hypothetical protein